MLHDIVRKGSTDRSVAVKIIDSTDGTPETGVVFNTAGIDLWYRREGEVATDVTEATLAALTTAHTDGGFLHIADGVYRLDLPDAAFATGANYVDFGGTVTGMIVIGGRVRLIDADFEAAILTETEVATAVWANATRELTGFDSAFKTGYALSTAGIQAIWDALTSALTAVGSIGKLIVDNLDAAISSRLASASYTVPLDAAGVRSAVGLASANLDTQLDALPTAAENADAVWDETLSGHLTAGSTGNALNAAGSAGDPWSTALPGAYGAGTAGKIIGDNLNATVSSRASQTSLDTVDDFLDTEVAAIKAKTDNLPASPAATGDIPSAATVASQVRTELTTELGRIDAAITTRLASTDTGAGLTAVPWNAAWDAEVQSEVQDALDAVLADSVPADGSRPSSAQALYAIYQFLTERSVSGTTLTVRKPDGSTALMTFTLNDAASPTSITRAS